MVSLLQRTFFSKCFFNKIFRKLLTKSWGAGQALLTPLPKKNQSLIPSAQYVAKFRLTSCWGIKIQLARSEFFIGDKI